ncbi:hypothetical protein TSUD_241560 [Trifolium subterraneum]|uniref:Uncharacterized protein n=1 Tax=Trifolium subterraneum TaxID=3900 RepID=A0A2Z6PW01_TRISU|nr:hypothetical protein TSUD_241560 [Trifolium subterraneum]
MSRMPGLKTGAWTPEEDKMLIAYVTRHGHGNWHSLPSRAGNKHRFSHRDVNIVRMSDHRNIDP